MWFNFDPQDLQSRSGYGTAVRYAAPSSSHTYGLRIGKPLSEAGVAMLPMVDPADALEDLISKRPERGQIQRDWILASAECDRQARDALAKAAEVLNEHFPGRTADTELARAGADIGQRWATLSQAEAARSIAAAAFAVD